MCSGCSECEDCYYCDRVLHSRFVSDSFDLDKCESCYECIHGTNLYGCVLSRNCHSSSNLTLCENCFGCRDCFGCSDLRNMQFCIANKQLSEEAYLKVISSLKADIDKQVLKNQTERSHYLLNCEDCSGEQLINCSNCHCCFSVKESQDCSYIGSGIKLVDCYDANFF